MGNTCIGTKTPTNNIHIDIDIENNCEEYIKSHSLNQSNHYIVNYPDHIKRKIQQFIQNHIMNYAISKILLVLFAEKHKKIIIYHWKHIISIVKKQQKMPLIGKNLENLLTIVIIFKLV